MTQVFISYRRSDVPAHAGRIADQLRAHASQPTVFHDVAEILAGDLWRERIDKALAQSEVMLVVIGPGWLVTAPGAAQPRLFEPDDVVAYEIEAALKKGIRVVPLRVGGATLPTQPQLPPSLADLLRSNAFELRDDAFARDLRALESAFLPKPPRRLGRWVAAGLAVVAVAVGVGWLFGPSGKPTIVIKPGAAALAGVDLDVDVAFVPHEAMRDLPAHSMELQPEKPKRSGALLLKRQPLAADAKLHFVFEKFTLPPAGSTFVGTLVRNLDGAVQVNGHNLHAIHTPVCLDITKAKPPADGTLRLDCPEGDACTPGEGSGNAIVVACGTQRSAWHWPELIASAVAQGASAPVQPDGPVPGDWIIPRLKALQGRAGAARPAAYSEVTLTLVPPAAAQGAEEISYDLKINGHRLWVNGLPPWTQGVPMAPGQPVQVSFGLENLDASGAQRGHETLEVRLLWLRDKHTIADDSVTLNYTALRDLEEREVTSQGGLPIGWSARYVPVPADRYQVFAYGGYEADTLAAKRKLDAARIASSAAAGAAPLVGVVRPPNKANANWGVAIGVAQPSGQVRFSFDAAAMKSLCAQMIREEELLRRARFEPPGTFGVREIALERDDAAKAKPKIPCARFGAA